MSLLLTYYFMRLDIMEKISIMIDSTIFFMEKSKKKYQEKMDIEIAQGNCGGYAP